MIELKRNGNIINKKYLEYFLPTVLVALASNIAIMVDSIIVGNMLGSVSMAAISVLSPVNQIYFSTTILFGVGASTLISFARGKNDREAADTTFTAATILLVILSAAFMILQLTFVNNIAELLTPIESLRSELLKYYIPFIIGTPFSLLLPSAVHCIRSDGRPKFASNLIIISNVINLIMDIVLMGPFRMGIAGSAIATVIGNVIAFCIMLTHFKSKGNTLHFDLGTALSPKKLWKECVSLFTTGISGALGTMLVTVTTFYMNTAIQSAGGHEGMVSMSVASNCQIFISAFITGASQTMIPIVSALLGERDTAGIKYAMKRAILVLLIAAAAIMLIIEVAPAQVALIFGDKTPAEMAMIVPALRISALSFIGMSISFLFMYYFTATQRKAMSLTISIVNGIVLTIPPAYILERLFGITGLWMMLCADHYGTWIVIAAMIIVTIAKSNGRYRDIFLLDNADELLSFSVKSDADVSEIKSAVTDKIADGNKVAEAVSELFAFVSEQDKNAENDIIISREDGAYVILLRSNGAEIDVSKFNGKCKSFEYSVVLGMNQIKEII